MEREILVNRLFCKEVTVAEPWVEDRALWYFLHYENPTSLSQTSWILMRADVVQNDMVTIQHICFSSIEEDLTDTVPADFLRESPMFRNRLA